MSKNNTSINKMAEALFDQMAEVEPMATISTDNWDLRTRVSIEATKKEAKEKLTSLKDQFFSMLMQNASIVVMTEGVGAEEVERYSKSQNAIAVDAGALYRVLSESVERVMGKNREYGAFQLTHLTLAAKDAVSAVDGARFLTLPNPKEAVYLNNEQEVFEFVRQLVRDAGGDVLNKMHLERAIKQKAIGTRYVTNKPMVVVFGAGQDEARSLSQLFGPRAVVMNEVVEKKTKAEAVPVEEVEAKNQEETQQ